MRYRESAAWLACLLALASCGSRGEPAKSPLLSHGLKIFPTARSHVADFANDPHLAGSTAIEKADAFCNTDPNTPPVGTYKALIVDGVLRDAKSLTNWVLLPNTTYYRVYGDVEIGTTTSTAIFAAYWTPLTNSVVPDGPSIKAAWTGIGYPGDFTAGGTCAGWSSTASGSGNVGNVMAVDGFAFGGDYYGQGTAYCAPEAGWQPVVICVEQP